jgi:hypothetical protein
LVALTATGATMADTPPRITVRPVDTGAALVNPGMGWTMHFYSNFIENYGSKLAPSDTLEDWPGVSVVYLRVPWAFLEPREGEFNWSLFDTPAQRWIARGKQIAIRVSCAESWLRHATPRWVQDAGAKGVEFEFGKGVRPGGPLWEPDYLDPVFLQKLENFLAALARRYDGNPNVAFIDIGSVGMWGEGHTVFSTKLPDEEMLPIVKRHIDLHVKLFPRTLLCISDDAAGPTRPGPRLPATDYALSQGVTLRDDSILVSSKHPWFHAELAQAFWPRLPVILEHEHFASVKARTKWNGDTLLEAIEAYRASYMSIHGWPRDVLNEWRDAIGKINQRLGYRLQLRAASWPASAEMGKPFSVETDWANTGVAPCYGGGYWAFTLKDERGGIVSVQVDDAFDFKTLPVAEPNAAPTVRREGRFTVAQAFAGRNRATHAPPVKPGTFDVFVSVGLRDGTPRLALPLEGDDGQRRYKLGRMQLAAAEATN